MRQDLEVRAGYDKRFGTIAFDVQSKFGMNVREFLASLNIDPNDFAALMEDRYQWTEGDADIEGARVRLLEETDWQGKTCLDLAGYDGSMAKIAIEHGATQAVVADSEQWRIYGWPQPEPIQGVQFVKSDLYEWKEPADIVIWYNCLYHVPDPWRALRHVRTLTKERMLLCTLFRYHKGSWIYMYLPYECNSTDPTVYFGFSLEALERILKLTGWTATRYALTHDRVLYDCVPTPDFVDAEEEGIRRASSGDLR